MGGSVGGGANGGSDSSSSSSGGGQHDNSFWRSKAPRNFQPHTQESDDDDRRAAPSRSRTPTARSRYDESWDPLSDDDAAFSRSSRDDEI